MKAIRNKAITSIVLILTFALSACARSGFPFDIDNIEKAWIVTMPDGIEIAVSDSELAELLENLQSAETQDITNKADPPTPTHLLVFCTEGNNSVEYTLSISDGIVNALLFELGGKSKVYRVQSEEMNTIVSSLINEYAKH